MSFLASLRKTKKISERELATAAGIARETLRTCEHDLANAKVETIERIAQALEHVVLVTIVPQSMPLSEYSVVAVSLATARDGFESWKIHFMDFVDYFRSTCDARLILLPPVSTLDQRLKSLIAAIVLTLCEELQIEIPDWASQEQFLAEPWFIAGMESLKASVLVESPLAFRRNNIFVQSNFLQRA